MSSDPNSSKPTLCVECAKPMDSPMCCRTCGALNPLPADALDYFELFGLPRAYEINSHQLHSKYLALSRSVHPDAQAGEPAEVRSRSLTLSAELNRAYGTLRDPVSRAEYLLALAGGPTAGEDKSVPGDLLADVMSAREAIEEAKATSAGEQMSRLRAEIEEQRRCLLEEIGARCRSLDTADQPVRTALRQQINAIKYWDNLLEQLPADGGS